MPQGLRSAFRDFSCPMLHERVETIATLRKSCAWAHVGGARIGGRGRAGMTTRRRHEPRSSRIQPLRRFAALAFAGPLWNVPRRMQGRRAASCERATPALRYGETGGLRRRWWHLAAFAVAIAMSEALIGTLKGIYDRPRPLHSLVTTSAASFPSGHAIAASVTVDAVVLAVVLALAGGLIAGTFGGWRAARLRPAAALARVE